MTERPRSLRLFVSKRKPTPITQPDNSLRLKKIVPVTKTQKDVFQAYAEGLNLFLYGSAGIGKTFVALALALRDVLSGLTAYRKVIIVRSNVPSRDVGFLPGKLEDKIAVYISRIRRCVANCLGEVMLGTF